MKKLLLLFIGVLLIIWWVEKNDKNIISKFLSSEISSSTLSTSPVKEKTEKLGDKIEELANFREILKGFEMATNSPMNDNFSTHVASLSFPKSYFIRSISEAFIDGGIGETLCSTTLKTGQMLSVPEQKNIRGLSVNRSTWSDAGAGNMYSGIVYTLKKGNTCYGITLFLHSTQPENYANSEAEATQFRAEHDIAVKKITDTFENAILSFSEKQ